MAIAGLSVVLMVAAFVAPDSWIEPFTTFFGATADEPTAFGDDSAALDAALERGEDFVWSPESLRELAPAVGVRRALRAGPMTAEEVAEATKIFEQFLGPDGATLVDTTQLEAALLQACPRLDAGRLSSELAEYRRQLQLANRANAPGGGTTTAAATTGDCSSCHASTFTLPGEKTFDVVGIYPHTASHPAFQGGRNIPVLSEAIELEADEAQACTDCHLEHGEEGFELTMAERVENMGLWVEVSMRERGIVHVQVKTKNAESGHRAPAGHPRHAYVVTVEARQGERLLPLRYGKRVPVHLRTPERIAGVAFARHMVDAAKMVTTDVERAADLLFDSRLESGRFSEDDFVFDRHDDSPVAVVVTLWDVPDYSTWAGARPIRRAKEDAR